MMRRVFCLFLLGGCYLSHYPEDGGREDDAGVDVLPFDAAADSALDVRLVDAVSTCDGSPELCSASAVLDGLRWELPCRGDTAWEDVCSTSRSTDDSTLFAPAFRGRTFAVTLRIRGVVETKEYRGGITRGHFNEGGSPDSTNWNVYSLTTSAPRRTYYLNAGAREPRHCEGVDFVEVIEIEGGSNVELIGLAFDERQIRNHDEAGEPIVVEGVRPAPDAFDGQFLQMDVLAIEER